MADVKWIKIVTNVFDDEKIRFIETMPNGDAIIVIWFKLLCLCGKSNAGGFLMITDKLAYTDEMLASIFNRDIKEIQMALKTFEMLEMIELMDNRIYISNWEKHQSLDKLEAKKLYDREYQRKKREEKKKLLENRTTIVRESNENRTLEIEEDKDIEEDIEINNKRKKESKTTYDHILLTIENDQLRDAFREFIKMRKLIKAPLTDYALKLAINKIMKMSSNDDERVAIVNQSVENGWKSFYELKENGSRNGSNGSKQPVRTEMLPDWFVKQQNGEKEEFEEADPNEIAEFERNLKELEKPFEERKKELQARLKEKYGK